MRGKKEKEKGEVIKLSAESLKKGTNVLCQEREKGLRKKSKKNLIYLTQGYTWQKKRRGDGLLTESERDCGEKKLKIKEKKMMKKKKKKADVRKEENIERMDLKVGGQSKRDIPIEFIFVYCGRLNLNIICAGNYNKKNS